MKTNFATREAQDANSSTITDATRDASKGLAATVERHLKEYFAAHDSGLPATGLYDRILQEIERPLIAVALLECRGNQLRTAELLGLNRNTLRKKIRELGLDARSGRRQRNEHAFDRLSHD